MTPAPWGEDELWYILDAMSHASTARPVGWRELTQVERIALLPHCARGFIGNGGFRYFYEGDVPLLEVARGFRELGFGQVAEACEQVAFALFPGGREPDASEDWEARQAVLQRADWDGFLPQEKVVWALPEPVLFQRVGQYVERHRAAFERWAPGSAA